MILDKTLEIADAFEINTGAAGTYLLGTIADLGLVEQGEPRMPNGGADQPLYLVIQVDQTAESGGAATAEFIIVSDAQEAIATDGSATVHARTGAHALAALVAGYRVCAVPLPMGNYERYLGVLQVTGTAAFIGGKVNVFLTQNPGRWTASANAAGA